MATEFEILAPEREPPSGKVTFEEFLEWCDEDTHAEWVGGVIELMSPIDELHDKLQRFLLMLIGHWVETYDLGEVREDPFVMRLPESLRRGRAPDILFVAREHLGRLKRTYLDGPADLAVEVVSPDSLSRDRGTKYEEYEKAGVPEYWIADPNRRQAECYQLGADGHYQLVLGGSSGIYRSKMLEGFWLDVAWLWQEPLPKVLDVIRQLGLID